MNSNDLACLLPIRDDSDIVYKHFVYYYNLGVRNFYALLHCGTKEDKSEIERFAKDSGANVKTIVNDNPEYNREKHYGTLSNAAKQHRWHIMSDTDEILILKKHNSLIDYLEDKNCDIIQFKRYAYCNTTDAPMFEWEHRCVHIHFNNPKSIMRYSPKLTWSLGHHYVYGSKMVLKENEDNAFYGHFILRDFEVFKRRRANMIIAMKLRYGINNNWYKAKDYNAVVNGTYDYRLKFLALKARAYNMYGMKYEPVKKELFILK